MLLADTQNNALIPIIITRLQIAAISLERRQRMPVMIAERRPLMLKVLHVRTKKKRGKKQPATLGDFCAKRSVSNNSRVVIVSFALSLLAFDEEVIRRR